MYVKGHELSWRSLLENADDLTKLYMQGLDTSSISPAEFTEKYLKARDEIYNFFRAENGFAPE